MPLLPESNAARIAFFKNRITNWTAEAVNIGTTTSAVSALDSAVTAATTALADQETAQSAAKTATLNLRLAMETMTNLGMTIVEQVRTKSRSAGAGVYVLADIPAPATPSGKGAPGETTNFKVQLENNGALSMTWKCANPAGTSGTSYMVWRRIGTEQLAFLGATGLKKFVDATIPAGTVTATYQIQAFRSTMAGPWAQFNVNFTTEIGGAMSAMVSPQSAKIAA